MFRRNLYFLCDRLCATVLFSVPQNDVITIAQLSRTLPEDAMEYISNEYGGLKEFLKEYPTTFRMVPIGPKKVLTVSRIEFTGKVELSKPEPAKAPKQQFQDPAQVPPDIIERLRTDLVDKPPFGVSSLYGALRGSDRKEIRKYGGILAVLRYHAEVFVVSPLGMLTGLRAAGLTVIQDEKTDAFDDVDSDGKIIIVPQGTPKAPSSAFAGNENAFFASPKDVIDGYMAVYAGGAQSLALPQQPSHTHDGGRMTMETLHYHTMFMARYMPLHWTIAADLIKAVPEKVQRIHLVVNWSTMLPLLADFLESKNGVGCKHTIKRLKRGVNIPDLGVIRSDEEMDDLQMTHAFYAHIINSGWVTIMTWKTLVYNMAHLPDMMRKMSGRFEATITRTLSTVLAVTAEGVNAAVPPEANRCPLSFQVLKATVPKHYVKLSTIAERLTRTARKEADTHGGLLTWLRSNKEIYEVTIPYVKVNPKSRAPVAPPEARLAVRRRHTSYIVTTEDRVLDECRSALPRDMSRMSLRQLLALIPPDIVDAMPLDVVPFLLRVGFPCIFIDQSPKGRFYVRRGLERDDGSSGTPTIGEYDPAAEVAAPVELPSPEENAVPPEETAPSNGDTVMPTTDDYLAQCLKVAAPPEEVTLEDMKN